MNDSTGQSPAGGGRPELIGAALGVVVMIIVVGALAFALVNAIGLI